jgi:hypothetical protein
MKRVFSVIITLSSLMVSFTACKNDDGDLTGTITISISPDGQQANIKSDTPNDTVGVNTSGFYAMAWVNSGDTSIVRSLINYNLSQIPDNSKIISASLTLYNDPNGTVNGGLHSSESSNPGTGGDNGVYLRRITSVWNDTTVTWNTQPTTTSINQVSLPASTSTNQDYTVDVTSLIQDIVNNSKTSYGIMMSMKTETPYRAMIFASGDCTNSAKRPKLVVKYR